jgi:aminodeoxyfutalosine deaminase
VDGASAAVYLQRVPKTELHVHVEGGIRPERLLRILHRHGRRSEFRTAADLEFLYTHADFAAFLEHFRFAVMALRDVQDVHDVALDLCRELAAQQVVYAEPIFSPGIFMHLGMPLEELLAAATEAADAACHEAAPAGDWRYNFTVDLVRNFGPEYAVKTAEALGRAAHPRVVGVHLGGDEVGFPARSFATAFRVAREAGLGRAAHAGEAAGAESVRDAVEVLGAQRIGHGIRCLEDDSLVTDLVARGVTLEVCPTSNVRTGCVPDLARHPLPELLRRGLRVTLGADDPSFFATTLTSEMLLAHQTLGVALEAVDGMTDAGLQAAFLPDAERQRRLAALRQARSALRRECGLA